MRNLDWNDHAKRILKSELVRRGISNEDLVRLLDDIGVEETKASIDSKISRGTFSAAFFLQCLEAMGCRNLSFESESAIVINESKVPYQARRIKLKK